MNDRRRALLGGNGEKGLIYKAGWTAFRNCEITSDQFPADRKSFESDYLKLWKTSTATGYHRIVLGVDFTGYKKLVVEVRAHGQRESIVANTDTKIGYMTTATGSVRGINSEYLSTKQTVYEIDISSQQGYRWIGIQVYVKSTMYVYDIHLE
ncbi:MAG: hypothetical protein UIM25_00450 [Bacteroidales bacterium]|nr:hypothetical protein [Bacteroidales bacterium]